jgi:predicted nuclease with TOPRIM domain
MQEQLAQRLSALRQEYEKGRQKLETLDAERKALYETLLRISGAIQVLEEALNDADAPLSETDLPE